MDFLNGIIRYGVPIRGSAHILGDVILSINVNGTKLSTIKKVVDMFPWMHIST